MSDALSNAPQQLYMDDEEIIAKAPDLPQNPPLNHQNPFLSPEITPDFDVDAFLVSRAPGSTLSNINAEILSYSELIKKELEDVVDQDFLEFVNLGASFKAEAPRIARLDWRSQLTNTADEKDTFSSREDIQVKNNEIHWETRLETPKGTSGNLGLGRVRLEFSRIRDELRGVERAMQDTMAEKEAIQRKQADLKVLLNLHDSLSRLEHLVLPNDFLNSTSETDEIIQSNLQFWKSFDAMKELQTSDSGSISSLSDDESDVKHEHAHRASNRRDSSSRIRNYHQDRHTVGGSTNGVSNLTLPETIAKASSEYDALMFLKNQSLALGFQDFVEAHQSRLLRVQEALKTDLSTLLRALTAFDSASLLVGGKESSVDSPSSREDPLQTWSSTDNVYIERYAEQVSWFEMALSAWSKLPEVDLIDEMSGETEAETIVREALVRPYMQKLIVPDALSVKKDPVDKRVEQSIPIYSSDTKNEGWESILLDKQALQSKTKGDISNIVDLYNSILKFCVLYAERLCKLAEQSIIKLDNRDSNKTDIDHEKHFRKRQSKCDIYVGALWNEIAHRLMEQVGGQLFFVGRSEVFHKNYTVSMAFLEAFEGLAPSPLALSALSEDPVYLAFRKRWQLPVYFQMRYRDTVTPFEQALSSDRMSVLQLPARQSHELPFLKATQSTLEMFCLPWDDGVHIRELCHRQWRLSLQVLSRFRKWMREELPQELIPVHLRVTEASRNEPTEKKAPESSRSTSTTASPSRVGTPVGRDIDEENNTINLCTALAAEIYWFESHILSAFDQKVAPLISQPAKFHVHSKADDVVVMLKSVLQESLSLQTQLVPFLTSKVISILKNRCAEPLRLVRSVSTQYRSNAPSSSTSSDISKSSPEPSYFVNQFLRPVRTFLGRQEALPTEKRSSSTFSAQLPKAIREQWVSDIIDDFASRYTASLLTMSKNFDSLQRLKRVNAAGDNAQITNATEEAARMHSQMRADVSFLEQEVHDLRFIDTEIATDTPTWARLRQAANGELQDLGA